MEDLKTHWEKIYSSKNFEETSWYQEKPETSLNLIETLNLSHDAPVIDIGGGDSHLCDHLLKLGYSDLSVLDISKKAIERAKKRLGKKADEVSWIVSDVTDFKQEDKFELWHDRAAFHFLNEPEKINKYFENLKASLKSGGFVILGTFSDEGPEKCSGINVHRYSEAEMSALFEKDFDKISFQKLNHTTPWGAEQNFSFGVFRKK
ncbi:SAM-dependent methyltransferase [Christiangramia fulva]|uniref:SAM-dependent methyltransferase n=1 Tax=Christiangramia fulva TaxID=2126553 RepID=A0A2R3Z757_9FLAO|nr:class I SAM-dependent methyltransferase [Christiangramia fulva]AVR46064.1 SAM-dependent methyltransferase [Christiangramia fulva]